ncbi:hypothetical protein [Bacillus sp. AFS041924]|uniref:hypothetical protein n=1 Tax=Bacillus sp. AFS041924 TaxID=2033503 RepID=UPI000BFE2306|nr:hypothetical protein [Bacillus sp. AFS041924]PGS46513.1 hypothetical protein COC46_20910 [Bacillus sp. AFS041924]
MALDAKVYFKDNRLKGFKIEEHIHEEIFEKNTVWKSYKQLSKISDYYLYGLKMNKNDFLQFIEEWEEYSKWISEPLKIEYEKVLMELKGIFNSSEINYVKFLGD